MIHLLNYAPEPVSAVRVRMNLDREFRLLTGDQPRLLTPDTGTAGVTAVQRTNSAVEFSLETLKTYGVIVLEEGPEMDEQQAKEHKPKIASSEPLAHASILLSTARRMISGREGRAHRVLKP